MILVGLAGCASDPRQTTMDQALRSYEKSIKWGSFADAQKLIQQPQAQDLLDRYQAIEVISYEVLRQEIVGDFEQINQVVEIKFYHEQQATIKTIRDIQVWIYDEDRVSWVLTTGLPDFMSGVR